MCMPGQGDLRVLMCSIVDDVPRIAFLKIVKCTSSYVVTKIGLMHKDDKDELI